MLKAFLTVTLLLLFGTASTLAIDAGIYNTEESLEQAIEARTSSWDVRVQPVLRSCKSAFEVIAFVEDPDRQKRFPRFLEEFKESAVTLFKIAQTLGNDVVTLAGYNGQVLWEEYAGDINRMAEIASTRGWNIAEAYARETIERLAKEVIELRAWRESVEKKASEAKGSKSTTRFLDKAPVVAQADGEDIYNQTNPDPVLEPHITALLTAWITKRLPFSMEGQLKYLTTLDTKDKDWERWYIKTYAIVGTEAPPTELGRIRAGILTRHDIIKGIEWRYAYDLIKIYAALVNVGLKVAKGMDTNTPRLPTLGGGLSVNWVFIESSTRYWEVNGHGGMNKGFFPGSEYLPHYLLDVLRDPQHATKIWDPKSKGHIVSKLLKMAMGFKHATGGSGLNRNPQAVTEEAVENGIWAASDVRLSGSLRATNRKFSNRRVTNSALGQPSQVNQQGVANNV